MKVKNYIRVAFVTLFIISISVLGFACGVDNSTNGFTPQPPNIQIPNLPSETEKPDEENKPQNPNDDYFDDSVIVDLENAIDILKVKLSSWGLVKGYENLDDCFDIAYKADRTYLIVNSQFLDSSIIETVYKEHFSKPTQIIHGYSIKPLQQLSYMILDIEKL